MTDLLDHLPGAEYYNPILVVWVLWIVIFRLSNFYKLKACPACGGHLKRSKKTKMEQIIKVMSIGILGVKKYRCYKCNWTGMVLPSYIEKFHNPTRLSSKDIEEARENEED